MCSQSVCIHLFLLHFSAVTLTSLLHLYLSIYLFISNVLYTCRVFTPCLFHCHDTYVHKLCVCTHLLLPLHISGMTSTLSLLLGPQCVSIYTFIWNIILNTFSHHVYSIVTIHVLTSFFFISLV